jgi:hypothetical protein
MDRNGEGDWETCRQKEVGNIVCDIHCDSHIREMEAVAEPDQTDGDDVVRNQLAEILPRLLEHKEQYNELLCPVTCLEQVVCLDKCLVCAMREILVHACGVEVPDRCACHDPQPKRAVQSKVEGGVGLLHESRLFRATLDTIVDGYGPNEPLHAKLSREAQHNDVEADKRKVACALAIVGRAVRVCAHVCGYERVAAVEGIRNEETGGYRVRGIRVYGIERGDEEAENQRAEPCVSYALAPEFGKRAAHGATLGAAAGLV